MANDLTNKDIGTAAAQSGGYDQDGNGIAFDDYYGTLSDSLAFNDTIMSHIHGQPIGTIGYITNGKNSSSNLHIVNSTFSDLEAGEHVVFGEPGQLTRFSNLTFENAHGTVTFNGIGDNIQVASGNLTIQLGANSQLNNTQMGSESRIALVTGNNVLSNPNIDGATFNEGSDLSHGRFRGGSINATFDNVNCSNAEFSNVYLAGDISGNFNNVNFRNGALAVQNPHLMQVNDSTTFFRMQVCEQLPGQEPRWTEINDIAQFREIQARSAAFAASQQVVPMLSGALQQINERSPEPTAQAALSATKAFELLGAAPAADAKGYELRQSPTAILNPAAIMTGDATQPGQSASGGLTRADETVAETIARLGGALTQYSDTPVSENLNQKTLTTPEALAARVAAIMDRDLGIG